MLFIKEEQWSDISLIWTWYDSGGAKKTQFWRRIEIQVWGGYSRAAFSQHVTLSGANLFSVCVCVSLCVRSAAINVFVCLCVMYRQVRL